MAKLVAVDASPTLTTACPAEEGGVKVIAPAVDGERKYKSPASKPDIVFNPITITFTVAFAEASALANPTT